MANINFIVKNDIELKGNLIFEGATKDQYETTLTITDPTADRIITFPNSSGTVSLTSDLSAYLTTSSASSTYAPILSPTLTGTTTVTNLTATTSYSGGVPANQTTTYAHSPTGIISPFAGITLPTGWLLCDGSSVSRSTYSALFSTLSYSWTNATVSNTSTTVSGLTGMSATAHVGWGIAGTGIPTGATILSVTNSTTVIISAAATATATGTANVAVGPYGFTGAGNTTTFNLPNFKGKTAVGLDSSQTEFNTLGETGGSKTSVASHDHSISHDHASFNATSGGVSADHSHGFDLNIVHSDGTIVTGEILNVGIFYGSGRSRYQDGTNGTGDHTHTTAIDVPSFTGTSGAASTGITSGNLQPYITVNYIIKY